MEEKESQLLLKAAFAAYLYIIFILPALGLTSCFLRFLLTALYFRLKALSDLIIGNQVYLKLTGCKLI